MTYAAAVLRRCDELAAFSEEEGRLTRRFATPALRQAGETVREWMEAAGMAVRRDAIGNLIGRLGDGDRRTLLIGSHLDTVRDAGRYDGMLGVLVAIACLERLRDQRAVAAVRRRGARVRRRGRRPLRHRLPRQQRRRRLFRRAPIWSGATPTA